jgi:hypothetical protein
MFELEILNYDLSICKFGKPADADAAAAGPDVHISAPADLSCVLSDIFRAGKIFFLQKTPDEISLVCESRNVPAGADAASSGWKALRVVGTLDFGLVGVLAKITAALAEAGVGVFVVSTYDTDYILMKSDAFEKGVRALRMSGYKITR